MSLPWNKAVASPFVERQDGVSSSVDENVWRKFDASPSMRRCKLHMPLREMKFARNSPQAVKSTS